MMAKGLGLPLQQGVVIADVEPNGPGDLAGLKRRDIILSLNTHVVETPASSKMTFTGGMAAKRLAW